MRDNFGSTRRTTNGDVPPGDNEDSSHYHFDDRLSSRLQYPLHPKGTNEESLPPSKRNGIAIVEIWPSDIISKNANPADMSIADVMNFGRIFTERIAEIPAVKDIIVKGRFDAVVTEFFFSDIDSGFAAVLQVPWILLCSTIVDPHLEHMVDTVRSVPVVPLPLSLLPMPMNTWERMQNLFGHLFLSYTTWRSFPIQKESYNRLFSPLANARGNTLPSFEEAYTNVSILFVNSHPTFVPVKSLPPNVIDIAGYHIGTTIPPLPKTSFQ
ncbi:UDP-glucosyltransferase 2-like [Colias croceus]|uniref:UDP-glucosyltransferase 2-like n=1 Tax=Colias crocea TaxID=72248 RepID=UPI001E27F466|nr:UDP-glucosyltransferase 2-like [Colias croceus]